MGEALLAGLLRSGRWRAQDILAIDIRPGRRRHLARAYGVRTSGRVADAQGAGTVVLAVKPQQMNVVLTQLAPHLRASQTVISIAAGVPLRTIEEYLVRIPVIRVMPNTPALVGEGASAIAAGRWARNGQVRLAEEIFSTVGRVSRVSEGAMDAVTAVSGSGPAYVFYVAEALEEAARALGLSAELARNLVKQTLLGSSRLLAHSDQDPRELRRRVTSPGGTTEAALEVLERRSLKRTFLKAVQAAQKRARQLAQRLL